MAGRKNRTGNVLDKYVGSWVYIESNEDRHEKSCYCYNHYVGKIIDCDGDFVEFRPFKRISGRHFSGPSFDKVLEYIREYETSGRSSGFESKDTETVRNRGFIEDMKKINLNENN